MRSASGHFENDGGAIILGIGFIPDRFELWNDDGTNPDNIIWTRGMERETGIYGFLNTGSTGEVTRLTTAATGISAYDSASNGVLVESPKPGRGLIETAVSDWAAATSYASGERSATAIGTIVRPPTHNGKVYELTTDTGAGTSEPSSWPTTPGTTCTDGGGNVWTCRDEQVAASGKKGVTIGASVSQNSNGYEGYWFAVKDDHGDNDLGDMADYGASDIVPIR